MKIKKGDKVKVITGDDKGKIGDVLEVLPKSNKVVVAGVNQIKKHLKPTQDNPDGGILEKEAPIDVSNVAAYDSKAKKISRVGYKIEQNKKVRVYKQTGAVIKKKGGA